MLINNFSPILELIVALNIAYASIPQLAKTINDLFFDKLKEKIIELDKKVSPAKHNLGSINTDDVTDEDKSKIVEKIDSEITDTLQIKDSFESDVEYENKIISGQMRLYFILVGILSLGYLYIGGFQEDQNVFPAYEILNLYLVIILFCIVKNLYTLREDKTRNIMLGIFTLIFIGLYFSFQSSICTYVAGFCLSGYLLINLLFILSFIPLIITIIRYFISSNKISKEYKVPLEKQLSDIESLLDSISDVAKKPLATKLLNNVAEYHKDKVQ